MGRWRCCCANASSDGIRPSRVASPSAAASISARGFGGVHVKRFVIAAAMLLAPVLMAAPASAQTKAALTGEELSAVLSAAGLQADVIEDAKTGAPVATAQAGSIQFWVRALDCAGAPKACSTLMFFANFELGRDAGPADYQAVNAFNDRQVFGRAYLLPAKNLVGVDYVMELQGGVSPDHISKNIARWADVIDAFIAHFSSSAAGS